MCSVNVDYNIRRLTNCYFNQPNQNVVCLCFWSSDSSRIYIYIYIDNFIGYPVAHFASWLPPVLLRIRVPPIETICAVYYSLCIIVSWRTCNTGICLLLKCIWSIYCADYFLSGFDYRYKPTDEASPANNITRFEHCCNSYCWVTTIRSRLQSSLIY